MFTFVMVGGFCVVIYLGPFYLSLLVSWLALTIKDLLAVVPLTEFGSGCPIPQIESGQKSQSVQSFK